MKDKQITEMCEKCFATHKATLIQDTDRYLIIDWRKADGSGDYYVNYIVDKERGSLIVSGDLGDSIATWFNPLKPANLKKYIYRDVDYYIGKFRCTSDKYVYDSDDIISDIKGYLEDYNIQDFIETSNEFEDEQEFWDFIAEEVSYSMHDEFVPSRPLVDIIERIDPDSLEWLYRCGERISNRVYLWAHGFYMACEQLGI